jgi:hypothetical protein
MQYNFYDPRTKRPFNVHGEELANAKSTPKPHSPGRYTEIQVFRLEESGRFAVVVTGRSKLFHSGVHPCMKHGKPVGHLTTYAELFEDHVPCPRCKPAEYADDSAPAYVEEDRSRITICEDAPAVRTALEGKDPDSGASFLSGIGEDAWKQFAESQGIPDTQVFDIR